MRRSNLFVAFGVLAVVSMMLAFAPRAVIAQGPLGFTDTPTSTSTRTPTNTPTGSTTSTNTATPTNTPTATLTGTPPTATPTRVRRDTVTPTLTPIKTPLLPESGSVEPSDPSVRTIVLIGATLLAIGVAAIRIGRRRSA